MLHNFNQATILHQSLQFTPIYDMIMVKEKGRIRELNLALSIILLAFLSLQGNQRKEALPFWLYSLTLHVDYCPSNIYDIAVLLPCWVCRLLTYHTQQSKK